MLVKVVQQKLTLGRSVYQRGDIFECPPQEAQMMAAIGVGQLVLGATAVATREPPVAPRGFSMRKGPPVAYLPTRARRIGTSAQSGE